jgi:hypothetical protein
VVLDACRGRRGPCRAHGSPAEAGRLVDLFEPLRIRVEPVEEPFGHGIVLDAHDSELRSIVRRVDVLEDVPLVGTSLVRLDVRMDDLAGLSMNHDERRHD